MLEHSTSNPDTQSEGFATVLVRPVSGRVDVVMPGLRPGAAGVRARHQAATPGAAYDISWRTAVPEMSMALDNTTAASSNPNAAQVIRPLGSEPTHRFPVEKKAPGRGQLGKSSLRPGALVTPEGTHHMTVSPLSELLKATTLEFTIWHDPVAAVDGIPADSDDALVWWTPTLGPTAVLCLHRISRYLTTSPSMSFDIVKLAGAMGLVQRTALPPRKASPGRCTAWRCSG